MPTDIAEAAPKALDRLRQATGDLHRRLETRFDAERAFANPQRYQDLRGRYAAILASAAGILAPWLEGLHGLDFHERVQARGPLDDTGTRENVFPLPQSKAEALGMFYVLEGSTLGGRIIRRRIEASGSTLLPLAFLDPYGDSAALRWRSFLAVLDREVRGEPALARACRGAVAAFLTVERILCGAPP